jgi:hypothetical protein
MVRTALAVIGGYLAIGILVALTDFLFGQLVPGFKSMTRPPVYYFAVSLATDTVYSAFGGFLCARLAKDRASAATAGLAVIGELIGIVAQIALWKTVPHWFAFGLLILYPPAVFIGSRMGKKTSLT